LEQAKCFIKTGFGVSDRFYQSPDDKQTFGLGQGSTAASDMWCIIHRILLHTAATYFIGIVILSVYGSAHHKRVGEGFIDDIGHVASSKSSIEITPTRNKYFSPDESALFTKMQKILQFFLKLLQVAGGDLNI
jgi:hypothetical protein